MSTWTQISMDDAVALLKREDYPESTLQAFIRHFTGRPIWIRPSGDGWEFGDSEFGDGAP
ncbi:hypothetical protein [Arthrobacter sp. UM1]|uniref:hypothetical protein n=1 Tax=Arthrobacter sp. UM1 TaxID=2766776 RepID=UPI001CF6C1DE|nr:hypothetical protein [Arthrobacter sp. UM1]MCB4207852.1 hypothetical protein [Arthrobacter sp. UM1]